MHGKLWRRLLNPGGGLRYHARAALYRKSRWRDFRDGLAHWLTDWVSASEAVKLQLLLIAPSAGHCLPSQWLGAFQSVTAIDLDPMAPVLFRRNHGAALPSSRLQWVQGDVFQEWKPLLAAHPDHLILLSNFLGQAGEVNEKAAQAWFSLLPQSLQKRRWASFHDRYSGSIPTRKAAAPLETSSRAKAQELLAHFYSRESTGELCEHELPPLFLQDAPYTYWSWEIAPDQFHVIEGFRS